MHLHHFSSRDNELRVISAHQIVSRGGQVVWSLHSQLASDRGNLKNKRLGLSGSWHGISSYITSHYQTKRRKERYVEKYFCLVSCIFVSEVVFFLFVVEKLCHCEEESWCICTSHFLHLISGKDPDTINPPFTLHFDFTSTCVLLC